MDINLIPIVVNMNVDEFNQVYDFTISGNTEGISLDIATPIQPISGEEYKGDYTVTPSNTPQVLEIEGLFASSNITVEAIPNNYGLITWDGSVLTVS